MSVDWTLMAIYAVMIAVYFIPSFVAFGRRHPNRWAILVINFLFGATGLGWLGSLIWAASAVHRSPTGNHGGESGLNIFANDPITVRLEPSLADGMRERPHGGFAAAHTSPAGEPTGKREPTEILGRLQRLRDDGEINADEYAELRRRYLEGLVR